MVQLGRTRARGRGGRFAAAIMLALFSAAAVPANAVIIELKDVASDRVERQRAEAIGHLPLPGTPNIAQLPERLAAKKMAPGNHMLIRVFKASSELEVWLRNGPRYELFSTYPICNWSGTLGPKISEGDKQSPEGIYTVTSRQLHLIGRHPRSLNLGFPNALDRQMSRTGSYILIHGGCGSVGCFAMTNPVIEEVFSLASAALNKGGQDAVQVHVFPFRMTEERLKAYALNEWYDFWRNLKDVSDSFERTHTPPRVTVCEGRYWVEDGANPQEVASQGPLAVCAVSRAEAALQSEPDNARQELQPEPGQPWWPLRAMLHPSQVPSRARAPMVHSPRERLSTVPSLAQSSGRPFWRSLRAPLNPTSISPPPTNQTSLKKSAPTNQPLPNPASLPPNVASQSATTTTGPLAARRAPPAALQATVSIPPPTISCDLNRASCRHHTARQMALYQARVAEDAQRQQQRVRLARR